MHDKGTALPAGQGTSSRGRARRSQVAYTVAEFAALLGKHPNTVYEWIRKGQIPFERIGNSYFIPEWALGCLRSHAANDALTAAPRRGGEAA
jgi:excisionase family DNA binding protein